MKPIFNKQPLKPAEISALTAFFQQASKEAGTENASAYRLRFILLGLSFSMRLLVVHQTHRAGGGVLRIISARKATRAERDQ